jgi:hypothetical protein
VKCLRMSMPMNEHTLVHGIGRLFLPAFLWDSLDVSSHAARVTPYNTARATPRDTCTSANTPRRVR